MPERSIAIEAVEAAREEHLEQAEEQPILDFELLSDLLEDQVDQLSKTFKTKHRRLLRWAHNRGYTLDFLATSSAKVAVTGGLMASILMSTPQSLAGITPHTVETQQQQQLEAAVTARKKYQATVQEAAIKHQQEQQQLVVNLQNIVSEPALKTDTALSDKTADMVAQLTGITTTAQLDGYRLNTVVGRIGQEQHLKRYPGESLTEHFSTASDRVAYESSGFAPGLGAYGYFAPSKAALTEEAVARERYYVAVQTFASPNWQQNVQATYNWYRFRKVLVYSPTTKQAVVADIADAGPALSTGKSFGGSPEVMAALQAHDGHGTPPVLMLFVDDPKNEVPLGPVSYSIVQQELAVP